MIAPDQVIAFWSGATAMGFLVAALFFLRFWRRTADGLFAAFAVAFVLMAANQATPVLLGLRSEEISGVYILRLAAFLLIILAILRKNFGRG